MEAGGFGWGTWIRTKTNRVRVCCATVTPFPNVITEQNQRFNGFAGNCRRGLGCKSPAASLAFLYPQASGLASMRKALPGHLAGQRSAGFLDAAFGAEAGVSQCCERWLEAHIDRARLSRESRGFSRCEMFAGALLLVLPIGRAARLHHRLMI